MSPTASRPYADGDLPEILGFVRRAAAAYKPGTAYWHPGDIIWRLRGLDGAEPDRNVHLWLDGSEIVAVALYEPPDHAEFEVLPRLGGQLIPSILAWAEQRCRAAAADGSAAQGALSMETTALESDAGRVASLATRGYTRIERHAVRMQRSLGATIAPLLPAGGRVRHVLEADVAERVDTHRDAWSVWGPSDFSEAAYRRLRAAPGYQPELDLVLAVETGGFGSYCVCWLDESNAEGYFEPVGTRPACTRRGFAAAVIVEGLRRLRERGMRDALVQTASINAPALATYLACGFDIVEREYFYVRAL